MCIFAALYKGEPLFECGDSKIMESWVDTLGPLPSSWKDSYYEQDGRDDSSWYDQTRKPKGEKSLKYFVDIEALPSRTDELERDRVLSILQKGLCYEPSKRPSADELLTDPSFTALMARYNL
ncbi:hypothetical protein GGS20DRAFT_533357 [Poronia punctata]|nr:hypothetical protein GGS20DRAFT_533357 [Poronia punctata]